jgi:hypothetical protein
LNNYFGIKKGLENGPASFFYLYGDSNFGVKSIISNIGKLKHVWKKVIFIGTQYNGSFQITIEKRSFEERKKLWKFIDHKILEIIN